MTEYNQRYYQMHRLEIKLRVKDYKEKYPDKRRQCQRNYKVNHKRVQKYLGVCVCPKCGKKGYKYSYTTTYDNGNKHIFVEVQHLKWNGHKSVYESVCYVNCVSVCAQEIKIEAKTTFLLLQRTNSDFSLKSQKTESNGESKA